MSRTSSAASMAQSRAEFFRARAARLPPPAPSTLQQRQKTPAEMSLLEYVTFANPGYLPPYHLAPVISVLERVARGEMVKAVIHTPPRGGKTETLLTGVSWLLHRRPELITGYGTYAEDLANEKSRYARELALATGLKLAVKNVTGWRTTGGGGLTPRGIGGAMTGKGFHLGIVDDPHKDRLQAESSVYRDRAASWFRSVFYTRRAPGSSILVNMARWHDDDLAGRILKGQFGQGWEHITIPALDDEGRSYWPERWSADALNDIKQTLGAYEWEALYQGRPRPRGGSVFGEPWGYSSLPDGSKARRYGIGLDLAYSKKTSSDYSVLVVMLHCEGYFYVVDVVRVQAQAPDFKEMVRAYKARFPSARIRWYASGTEEGAAQFFNQGSLHVEVMKPAGDKFVRSIPYAAMWNAHKVLVPEDSAAHPWVNAFLAEHATFTGVNDTKDDQVDAGATAFDVVANSGPTYEGLPERQGERVPGRDGARRM